MIPPIQPVNGLNLRNKGEAKDTTLTAAPPKIDEPVEWFCGGCKNYFKVPDPVRYIYDNEKGELVRKKQLNCPFCGSTDICNNKAQCFREKLWQKI